MELPGWHVMTLGGSVAPSQNIFSDKLSLLLFFNIGNKECLEAALPHSRKLKYRYPDLNLIGIHSHREPRHFLPAQIHYVTEKKQIYYPVFQDQGRKTFEMFRATAMPHWILLDKSPKVIKSIEGAHPVALQELSFILEALFYGYS